MHETSAGTRAGSSSVRSSGAKTWVWKRLKTASTTSSFATLGWAILMSSTCGSDRAFVHDPGGGMDCEKVALHPAHVSKALGYFPYADSHQSRIIPDALIERERGTLLSSGWFVANPDITPVLEVTSGWAVTRPKLEKLGFPRPLFSMNARIVRQRSSCSWLRGPERLHGIEPRCAYAGKREAALATEQARRTP
jgi:hypothetical protein